jgi:pimeloyl-ACP methyl ester carboxylesterase/DNA-binding winged helix-turn-helix (wHTH) protein/class 3 adenylate cyclase
MSGRLDTMYSFGPFRMDAAQGLLRSGEDEIVLTPKAFDTLRVLVERAGNIVPKDEILRTVWPDSFVDENNLAQNISIVRKALAGVDPSSTYVQTVPRRGYRFIAPVIRLQEPASAFAGALVRDELPRPETRYARSGDVNIAYQVVGDHPVDLVFVMGWVSHLEMFWEEPSFARFLRRLASFSRLILFDKRGTGLSDSVPLSRLPTLEQRMDDVRAVMAAVGSRRAVLVGVSEGATMCSLFAATYPESTAGVVLIGGYARRLWSPDYPWGPTREARDAFISALEAEWGGPFGLEDRAPSRAQDPLFREWWARYLRMGASPGAAAALTRMNAEIDIRGVLPSVRVPALVIHRTGDRCLKVEEGRYLARHMPAARFVELPGEDHLPFVGDQESILDAVERFVRELGGGTERHLVLATVLSTRLLGSPDPAALEKLREEAAREISWYRGTAIGSLGEGPAAFFDGPARAIRCAVALAGSAEELGLRIGIALHTGECDLVEGQLAGVAVGVAARAAGRAHGGEVIVTSTVRDLVAGAGLTFTEIGAADFDELGFWQLASVDAG